MKRFSTSITVSGKRVELPPEDVKDTRGWRLGNSVFCPLGPAPTRAWMFMTRGALLELNAEAYHTLTWNHIESNVASGEVTTFKSLTFNDLIIVSARRVYQGGIDDDNALMLVEFADKRYVAANVSDSGSVRSNLRSYANSADYLTGADSQTWTTFVSNLWDACGSLGAFPGLPVTLPVDGVPEGSLQLGTNAYQSLNAILDLLDCAIAHDILSGGYSIVQLGDLQGIAGIDSYLQYDAQPVSSNASRTAAYIRIYRPYHRKSYGQERDTEIATNWLVDSAIPFPSILPTGLSGATGTLGLWDDLPVVLGENNSVTNSAATTTRDDNRKARYIARWSVNDEHKIYAGLISTITGATLVPGGQVRAVLWRDWGDHDENELGGTCTEYVSSPELVSGLKQTGETYCYEKCLHPSKEAYVQPDLSRQTYPNFPRLPNVVQVIHADADAGDVVEPDVETVVEDPEAEGAKPVYKMHTGKVRRWVSNDMVTLDDCWVLFIDDLTNKLGDVSAVQEDHYGPARLSGVSTCGETLLPVYVVRKGGVNEVGSIEVFEIKPSTTLPEPVLALGGEAEAVICILNKATGLYETTIKIIRVCDFYRSPGEWQGMLGLRGLCKKRSDGKYDIIWMERPALFTTGRLATGEGTPLSLNTIIAGTQSHFQQGEKPPFNLSYVDDHLQMFPMALGPASPGIVSTPSTGSVFISVWNERDTELQMLNCQQQTFYCRASLLENLKRDDVFAQVTNVSTEMFSPFNQDPRDNTTNGMQVLNPLNHIGIAGDNVFLMWLNTQNKWGVMSVDDTHHVGFVSAYDVTDGVTPVGSLLKVASNKSAKGIFSSSITNIPTFDCRIKFVDFSSTILTDHIVEINKFYPAKLVGFIIDGGTFPLYEACVGEQEWECVRTSSVAKGGTADFTLIDGDGVTTSVTVSGTPKWKAYVANKKAIAKRMPGTSVSSTYAINQIEC